MVKHNNCLDNSHFRKDWQRKVVCWFDQPAKKVRRRNARTEKAKKLAPRPVNLLRPVVRCPTVKYNLKQRAGRGFTLEELKAAKVNPKAARGVGIAVDHRRTNTNQEAFQQNVERLKLYNSKLIVFPKKGPKKARKGDSDKAACDGAVQVTSKMTLPITKKKTLQLARKVSSAERNASVTTTLRKAMTDGKLWGMRERRAVLKAENSKSAKGK